jgi:hypothetical protein
MATGDGTPIDHLREEADLRQRINDLIRQRDAASGPNREALAAGVQALEETLARLRESVGHAEQMSGQAKSLYKQYEKNAKSLRGSTLLAAQMVEWKKAQLREQHAIGLEQTRTAKEQAEEVRKAERAVYWAEEKLKLQEKYTISIDDSAKAGEDLGTALGGALSSKNAKNMSGFVKGAQDLGKAMTSPEGFVGFMKSGITTAWITLLGNVVGEVMALVTAVDGMSKSMRTGTLMSKELSDAATQLWQEDFREIGISAEDATAAMKGLYSTYSDFTRLATDEQKNIEKLVFTFEGIGVKSATSVKLLQTATTAFGMSATEADYAMRDISTHAEAIGLDVAQTTEKFAGMGSQLAKFGDTTQTFKELGNIMKVTGIEMEDILRITDKFDTFEGAATQAGKLNAALGGNFVNAMDLMMATNPAERFDMIRDSILDAGLSFQDMSYYQKIFYTEAAGLKDVSELNMLLRGDLEANNAAMQQQAKDMAEFRDLAVDLIPIGKKFMLAFQKMFEGVKTQEIIDFFEGLHDTVQTFLPVLKLLMAAFVGIGTFFAVIMIPVMIGVGTVVTAVASPIWGVVAAVLAVIALGVALWAFFGDFIKGILGAKDAVVGEHSLSFLQSLWATAEGFINIGISVVKIISPLHQIIRVFEVVSGAVSAAISGIANLFTALMDPGAADNIVKIAKAITAIPTENNVKFAASMASVATASDAMGTATTGNRVAGVVAAAAPGTGGGGRMEQRNYNINIVDKNGNITDKHILKVVGRDIESTLRQQRGV